MRRPFTIVHPVVCAAILLLSSTGCSIFRPSDKSVIGQANQVHGGIQPAIIQDAQVQQYMDRIGDRILKGAQAYDAEKGSESFKAQDNSWMYNGGVQFHLVNSKTLNAFTTGGNHIYIYNQLFQDAKSEDELAAVMAHEFAHVHERHVHNGMANQYGVLGASLAGAALGYVAGGRESGAQYAAVAGGAGGALGTFFAQGYTRADENDADKFGFSFYTRAGYDPDRFADFFKQMIEKGYDRPSQGSDHPSLKERVAATEQRVGNVNPEKLRGWRRPPIADAQQFQQLQRRAMQASANTPDDKSLEAAQLMLQAFPSCVTPEDQPDQRAAQKELLQAVNAPASEQRRAGKK